MTLTFRNAIVRRPCHSIINGLSSSGVGIPDYGKSVEQHSRYIKILEECGLTVSVLDADDNFPDSVFIEDVALCTSRCAIITKPGALSRKGETREMSNVLEKFFDNIEVISDPGTLEAGDVMMAGEHFFIGISQRTNHYGAEQLISMLEKYGYTGSTVPLSGLLHLKSGVSYLEDNVILVTEELAGIKEFKSFRKIVVPHHESYAANSVWLNNIVLLPEGYPETRKLIKNAGFDTIVSDVSEFRKLDGGLSCLSLRF